MNLCCSRSFCFSWYFGLVNFLTNNFDTTHLFHVIDSKRNLKPSLNSQLALVPVNMVAYTVTWDSFSSAYG